MIFALRPRRLLAALLATAFLTGSLAAQSPYKGAILMDAADGRVLFEENADTVTPPASVTKLMTFLVVHDAIREGALQLDTPIIVNAADSRIGGTQVWLKEREETTVRELLYALMIQSANDAAHALARTAAGSVPAFVERMNRRAADLGLTHTTFRTPHGLPPANRRIAEGDLTTPRDLALLSRHLLERTDILTYTSVKVRDFRPGHPTARIEMRNHNHLLGSVAGVDGLKTGYTASAGFCLAASATRDGRRVVAVIMGAPERRLRDIKMAELIERGFAALPAAPALNVPRTQPVISHAPLPPEAKTEESSPVIKFNLPPR
ncbi:MAG TPA: D-alanyl-D-alanine carboxypeptidase family protein [Opitutaceae bacterium]|nr:D-alanyl-D-alanine carboxypeptidase family protein [Opitutaceae bacterium]